MKKVACHECGTALSGNAMFCNKCGARVRKRRNKWIIIPISIFGLFVLFFVIGVVSELSGGKNNTALNASNTSIPIITSTPTQSNSQYPTPTAIPTITPSPTPKPITVDAVSLSKDYSDNTVKADNDYKDKVITVTGTVESISKDIWGNAFIMVGNGALDDIHCTFTAKDQLDFLATLKKGDKIKVSGKCVGIDFMSPELINCTVIFK